MRPPRPFILLLALILAAAACGTGNGVEEPGVAPPEEPEPEEPAAPETPEETPADDETPPPPEGEAQHGGVLIVAHPADPTGLHPNRFGSTNDRNIITNIYDTLVEFDLSDYSIVPSLAESWEVTDDGLTWTFQLREGVRFHDGSDFTAADVVASVERAMQPEAGRTTTLLTRVESVDPVDDHTVEISLSQPDRILLSTLIDVYISPEDPDIDLSETPLGTGPFTFVRWDRNQEVEVERNPDYWREGLPYLDGIIYRTIPDGSVASLQLRNEDLHLLGSTPLGEVGPLQAAGMQFLMPAEGFNTGLYHFHVNTRREPWNNQALRQALSSALDREAAAQSVFGFIQVLSNPMEVNERFFNPDALSFNEHDLDRAQALLEEAGHPDGVDGGEMIVCGLGFQFNTLAQVVQSQAAEIGIDFDVTILDVGTYVDRTLGDNAGDFDLALCAQVPKPDEYDLINHPYAKLFIEAQGWIDERPEFFELLDEARSMVDDDEYFEAIQELQVMAMEGQSQIVIGGRLDPIAAQPYVHGFVAHTQGHLFLDSVWIES